MLLQFKAKYVFAFIQLQLNPSIQIIGVNRSCLHVRVRGPNWSRELVGQDVGVITYVYTGFCCNWDASVDISMSSLVDFPLSL